MELTLVEALKNGIAAHQAGQVQEAYKLYAYVLKAQPNHAEANHNMGVLAVSVDKMQEALAYFKIALEANPRIGQYWLSYIDALIKLGKLDDAKSLFNQARDKGAEGEEFEQIEKRLSEFSVSEAQSQDPDPPSEQLQSIISLYTEGHLQQAVSEISQMLEKFPNSAILYNIAGASNVGLMQFDIAINSYKKALKIRPNFAEVYSNMGDALKLRGDLNAAIDSYKKAVLIKPDFAVAYNSMGIALKDKGDLKEAIDCYRQAISLITDYAIAYYNLGNALRDKGDLELAIGSYEQAVIAEPDYADAYNNMGNCLKDKGDLDAAIDSYNKALKNNPDFAEAYNNIGISMKSKGDLEAAIESYKQAIKIKPGYAEAYYNIGVGQQEKGDLDKAIHSYKQAINIKPDYAQAYNNMGNVLKSKRDPEQAIDSFKQAIKYKSDFAEAYSNMGAVLHEEGDIEAAIDSYEQALRIRPNYADAFNNMGVSLADKGEIEASIECYKQALKIKPDYAGAYYNIGHALVVKGELEHGIQSLEMALKYSPDYQLALAKKLHQQAHICDWTGIQKDQNLIPILGITDKAVDPFGMMALEDAPERHRMRSEVYAKSTFKKNPLPLAPKPSQKPQRLRIGYFSADFKNHQVMYALIEVLEQHNRELFEVYAYSFGPDTSDEMRQRVIKAVDVFDNVKHMNNQTIALLARQDKIDIAIDLTGYTKNSRTGVFAYRAAPVQITMLGYPGTLGTSFIDYIMTDQTWLPPENQKFFSEKPIYLPYSQCALEANIPLLDTTPTRTELGLPEEGFVFCAINSAYKITPTEFDIWMRLLLQVDGSVLWLLESNQWARGNLVKEAEARGIDSERLVFQPLMVTDAASQQQYLSQFRQADLYLDTFIYGAGSTACNVLWAGVPVLTLIGQGMPTRMAASYLNVLGLSELITTKHETYEKIAFHLSTNPERLALLKQKLGDALLTSPLFDNALQTKYLENGYQQAYQRYFDDQLPDAIFVPEHP
jgi:protein O-GlcNAc transferase